MIALTNDDLAQLEELARRLGIQTTGEDRGETIRATKADGFLEGEAL